MTKDEIIRMAREAGFADGIAEFIGLSAFERFADLVASAAQAEEREACAKIAESKRHSPNFSLTSMPPQNGTAVDIANAIRARGQV